MDGLLARSRGNTVAVVDVSAGAASIAIIATAHKGPARVLASASSPISLEVRTAEQQKVAIAQEIEAAGAAAIKSYADAGHRGVINAAHIFVHAPWVTTST